MLQRKLRLHFISRIFDFTEKIFEVTTSYFIPLNCSTCYRGVCGLVASRVLCEIYKCKRCWYLLKTTALRHFPHNAWNWHNLVLLSLDLGVLVYLLWSHDLNVGVAAPPLLSGCVMTLTSCQSINFRLILINFNFQLPRKALFLLGVDLCGRVPRVGVSRPHPLLKVGVVRCRTYFARRLKPIKWFIFRYLKFVLRVILHLVESRRGRTRWAWFTRSAQTKLHKGHFTADVVGRLLCLCTYKTDQRGVSGRAVPPTTTDAQLSNIKHVILN